LNLADNMCLLQAIWPHSVQNQR